MQYQTHPESLLLRLSKTVAERENASLCLFKKFSISFLIKNVSSVKRLLKSLCTIISYIKPAFKKMQFPYTTCACLTE